MRSDAGDVAAAAELALLAQGGPELTSTQLMVRLLDELVAIDGSAEAMQNVESTRVKALAALMGCGTVSVMGAKVTLDFGAAPGCVSKNGVQVSGVVYLGVSKTNTTTSVHQRGLGDLATTGFSCQVGSSQPPSSSVCQSNDISYLFTAQPAWLTCGPRHSTIPRKYQTDPTELPRFRHSSRRFIGKVNESGCVWKIRPF